MDLKEFEGILEEATKGLKGQVEDANKKAVEALNQYETLKAELEKADNKDEVKTLELKVKNLQDMADVMAIKLKQGGNPIAKPMTGMQVLKAQFDEKKADLERFVKDKSGSITLSLKNNVTDLDVFGDRVIFGLREPGVDKERFRERFIFNLIQTINGGAGSNPLSWVEQQQVTTGTGVATDPAWTAESAEKPVMKWEWVENKVTAEFLAAASIVTKQAILNWPILRAEIEDNLMRELYDVLDNNIINGDGTSNSIYGIDYYAKSFSVGDIEAKTNVTDFDVIRAAIAQVRRGGAPTDRKRGGFNPNIGLISVDKAADMDMTKGTDGHYVLPPFTSSDGSVIKGVRLIETNFVEGDDFIVGDFSRYLFNVVEGLSIEIGYIDKQFLQNQFTIRGEIYGMGRVKANEAFAFVKGNFTDAKIALAAGPAT